MEFTTSGTLLAVINSSYFTLVFIVYSIMGEMNFALVDLKLENNQHKILTRLLVIVFMLVSLIPTASIVKAEYQNFDFRK